MSSSRKTPNHTKGLLHPRNLHRAPYDFSQLVERTPELGSFVVPHPGGGITIDFADPLAVKSLNRALLRLHYGLDHWDLPAGYLCPPIPSRADYLHHVADLLASDRNGVIPRGREIRVLDIGMGANAIYLLLGPPTYGWSMVGTEVDRGSLEWARQLIAANPGLAASIECRLQPDRDAIFENVTKPGETFALAICNPPFHASPEEAAAGTERKLKNLSRNRGAASPPGAKTAFRNFGGRANELWCPGGESAFIRRLIEESTARPLLCTWFTTLVSKQSSLPAIERHLARSRAVATRTIPLFAGQKQSRIVAWSFQSDEERSLRPPPSASSDLDS